MQDRPSLNCTSLPLTPCRWFTTRWLNIVSADYLRGGPSCLRGVQGDIGRYLLCMLHHGCLMMSWHQDKPSLVGKQLILTIPCHLLRGGTISLLVCRGIQGPRESRIGITADSQSCHRVKIVLGNIAPALSSHLPVRLVQVRLTCPGRLVQGRGHRCRPRRLIILTASHASSLEALRGILRLAIARGSFVIDARCVGCRGVLMLEHHG